MKRFPLLLLLFSFLGASVLYSAKFQWLPIDPADLSATASKIDPEADSEILYRFKQIEENRSDNVGYIEEYIRIKIYTEKGLSRYDKIDIEYNGKYDYIGANNVMARIIKPDGTIIPVEKNAFFSRDIFRADDTRYHALSFSFPSLEVGSIIEYHYAFQSEANYTYIKLDIADDVPTRKAFFRIFPGFYKGTTIVAKGGVNLSTLKKDDDNFYNCQFTDIPAFKKEPYMPPRSEVCPAILFVSASSNFDYWKSVGESFAEQSRSWLRKTKGIPELCKNITDKLPSDQKLAALYNYCRTQIRNTGIDARQFTKQEITSLKTNKNLTDLLQRKYGSGEDITILFVALARAAGYEAEMAYCNSTRVCIFRKSDQTSNTITTPYARFGAIAAIKNNGQWQFFAPAFPYTGPEQLPQQYQNTFALIVPKKGSCSWVATPSSKASLNKRTQNATFKLEPDGTLEGDVSIEYTGHIASDFKNKFDEKSDEKLDELFISNIRKTRHADTEVTSLAISGIRNPAAPLTITYHIRVPHYAERTGQRLFLVPAFFQKSKAPLFPSPTRSAAIFFPYSWSEKSKVTITLPDGFEMEEASSPISIPQGNAINYTAKISSRPSARQIIYTRNCEILPTRITAEYYSKLKAVFDHIHRQDAHAITLKRIATEAASAQ